jgi:putative zinc finger protein
MEPHDEFLELCALSTSGDLTEEERRELRVHLFECAECRQALKEFEAAVDVGVPLLSTKLAGASIEQSTLRPEARAEEPATPSVSDGRTAEADTAGDPKRAFAFAHRNGHPPTRVNWNYVWLPFAACLVLSAALATYTYRTGRSRQSEFDSPVSSIPSTAIAETLERQISDADHDRQGLKAQLIERDKFIANLRHEMDQQSSSLEQMKTAQANLEQSISSDEQEKQRLSDERNSLAQKLDATQASVRQMQAQLDLAEQQRSHGEAQDGSLVEQIKDLNAQLRDREQTINKQQDLLSYDRDIRELMGARDLYIAEVYDVGRDGATEKPCGRVFYTKGKSLRFYAYDLDQQPGVTNARTFQAWGRRGGDMQQALNLGIFYEDNAAKKRWVLRFDDPKTLEQIDAVFVTVEPNGGSRKPSGKPLLFAYLKIDPNHP